MRSISGGSVVWTGVVMAVLATLLVGTPTLAQDGMSGQPTSRPVRVLPEFKFDGTLDAAIAKLQDADSSLRVMVVWPTGAAKDDPHVTLALRNVTALDVLNVMQAAYRTIALKPIPATNGEIYVLQIAPSQPTGGGRRGGRGGFSDAGFGGGTGEAPPPQDVVRVYNLSSQVNSWIIDNSSALKNDDPAVAKGKALDAILSLMQTALNLLPEQGAKPMLQVHEPTLSVVFHGTGRQQEAIEDTMRVLPPSGSGRGGNSSNSSIVNSITELQNRVASLEREVVQLKGQNTTGSRGR